MSHPGKGAGRTPGADCERSQTGVTWLEILVRGARARSVSDAADAIALQLNRHGLVRELFDAVTITCFWVPLLLLGVLFVGTGEAMAWGGVAVLVGCCWMANVWEVSIWVRKIPPVIVDAVGIDLQASGTVPWSAIRAVRIDRRRLWLELGDGSAEFGAAGQPWFTAAHDNLMGDGGGGEINVPLRWIDATPDEVASQIGRFSPAPVRSANVPQAQAR